jgi:putative oxidoreductase
MTFLLGVTPVMHDFWNSPDDPTEMLNFLKNLALFGCLLTYTNMASSAKKAKSKVVKLKKSN